MGLEGPFNHSTAREVGIAPLPKNRGDAKSDATLPPLLAGMDKAKALAYVSRLFDAAQASAVIIYYPADVRDLARDAKQINDAPFVDCQLTERELEVLNAIVGGLSNKEISESLFVSTETVKSHVSTIISKLGVRDRTQAAVFAIRNSFVG